MKYIIQSFYNSSLSRKLFICLTVFFIIPLLIVAFIINNQVSQFMNANVCKTNLEVLKQTRAGIENIINDVEYISITLLSDYDLQDIISGRDKSLNSIESAKFMYNKNSIQPLMNSRPYISSICISNNSDVIYQFGDQVTKEDIRFHEEAAKLKGKVLWTPVYKLPYITMDDNSEKFIISAVRAYNSLMAIKQLATERVSIDEKTICNIYSGINIVKGSKIFIVDKSGTVISAQDKNLLTKKMGTQVYVKDALMSNEGFFKTHIKNTENTVFHYLIEGTGWQVIQTIPESELNKQILIINLIIIICISFCILFGIFFSLIQNTSILKPIKLLSKEMERVKKGNFDIDLKIMNKDEIGDLSNLFSDMVSKIRELIDSDYKSKIREKEAEVIAIQSQINPHFLYNTLDSIRWMAVGNKDYAVGEQIEALSDIFRHVLNKGKDMTTIKEELDHLNNYIFIQKSRYGDRIFVDIQVDDSLMEYITPKLILQPLVENSFQHGLESKVEGGKIHIQIEKLESGIKFSVTDDGMGTNQDKITKMISSKTESHNVFALNNINDRIQLKFGKEYGLKFSSQVGKGTTVEVVIPQLKASKEDTI